MEYENVDRILDPEACLSNLDIDYFGRLMPLTCVFDKPQETIPFYRPIRSIDKGRKNIQILFNRNIGYQIGHWICTYYDGVKLHVYDSLKQRRLHADHIRYLKMLYPYIDLEDEGNGEVAYEEVMPQDNDFDCGVYSIAYATSVVFGRDPKEEEYDRSQMRAHLVKMFKEGRLTPFPTTSKSRPRRRTIVRRGFYAKPNNKHDTDRRSRKR